MLFSFTNSVLTPRLIDSLHIQRDRGAWPPSPTSMTRTSFGWVGMFGIRKVVRDTSIHLESLWAYNPPLCIVSPTVNMFHRTTRCDSVLYLEPVGFRAAIGHTPMNIQLDTCPFTPGQVNKDLILAYPRIARFENGNWIVDSVKLRVNAPPFSASILNFVNGKLICYYFINHTVSIYKIFKVFGDSVIYETSGLRPYLNNSFCYVRDSTFIFPTTETTLGYSLLSDTVWTPAVGWSAPLDSCVNFTTASKWDSLFLYGQKLYAVPSRGISYVVKDLAPLARALPQPRDSLYEIDIDGNTVLVRFPNNFCGVYYVTNDSAILRGTILKYALTQPNIIGNTTVLVGYDGVSVYSIPPYNSVVDPFTGLLPTDYTLSNPYPNPFNSVVTFHFSIPKAGLTSYVVYDLLGRQVFKHEFGKLSVGKYLASWNGRNSTGQSTSSGVYFLRFQSGNFQAVKKIVLVK